MAELVCTPYAVGQGNEGVCIGLRIGPYRLLLDCGLRNLLTLPLEAPADFVICSHAHSDHARGLLHLHQRYPQLPIYCSEATARLLSLNWLDQDWQGQHDLAQTIPDFIQPLPWKEAIEVAVGLSLTLWPAGHLPGAASILITYQSPSAAGRSADPDGDAPPDMPLPAHPEARRYQVLYSGDCFLSQMRLVVGLPLESLRHVQPDVLILEGTYGTLQYPHRRQQENQLAAQIRQAITLCEHPPAVPRSIIMPVPLLGLGQELLMMMRSHYAFTGYPITIWVDPLIGAGCDRYQDLLPNLPENIQNFARHQPLFWDERVFPHVKRLLAEQATVAIAPPAIFIVHPATPLDLYCQRHPGEWIVFLPEMADLHRWQAEVSATVTYDWLDALKNSTASGTVQLEMYTLTDHCDYLSTTQLIHNLRPRHVLFIHGSPDHLAALANAETLQSRYQVHVPAAGQAIQLMLETDFWQPAPPTEAITYEGEVTETIKAVTIQLPPEVTSNPHWAQFADTGIIEVHWQDQQLILRGLSAAELQAQNRPKAISPERPSCFNCWYQHNQHCRNPDSPLFTRSVTPDGLCLEFEGGLLGGPATEEK